MVNLFACKGISSNYWNIKQNLETKRDVILCVRFGLPIVGMRSSKYGSVVDIRFVELRGIESTL